MNNVVLKDDLSKVAISNDYNDLSNKPLIQNKFENLNDVDVSNKQDKQVVAYSSDTGKFTTVDAETIGAGSNVKIEQISKMGVNGTSVIPEVINIPINTLDFKFPKVNVLKFMAGAQDVIKSVNSFSATESVDFIPDDKFIMDNKAYLKTQYLYNMNSIGTLLSDDEYVSELDLNSFKYEDNFAYSDSNKQITMNAVPNNRILFMNSDYNLSNVDNIDYFNITATGNIRVVSSVDSGENWLTYKNGNWTNVDITNLEDILANGITITDFNNISSSAWNSLNYTKKIRFAILFSMNNISDIVNVDELNVQYDAQGYWQEAKDSEYDVIYVSNTLLQVAIKIATDIKINY